jgi:hypothetical protein
VIEAPRRLVRVALVRGGVAFLATALIGQVAGLLAATLTDLPAGAFARLGWFEFGLFHGVPVVADAPSLVVGLGPAPTVASSHVELGVALLLGTWFAGWLLYRGGRATADAAGGGALARALAGSAVAIAYWVPAFLISLAVTLTIRLPGPLLSGVVELRSATVPSLLLPLALGLAAGAAGGLSSARSAVEDARVPRTEAIIAGGWRTFVVGLALSYAGLFVAGVLQPDDPAALLTPSTARYFQTVFARPDVGAVLLAHHLALSPDEALWALVPAMGGCDLARGTSSTAFLCYGRFPHGSGLPALVGPLLGQAPSGLGTRFGTAPWPYLLFLLAPGAAALLGGAWAARRARAGTGLEAAGIGAAAGAVFAGLVVVAGWLATVQVAWRTDLEPIGSARYRIGPDLVSGGALALLWGVVGGALGAVLAHRRAPAAVNANG